MRLSELQKQQSTQGTIMNKIDLIIDALDRVDTFDWNQRDNKIIKDALAAARELRGMKPVAWMWKDGTITTDPERADGTWTPLYALGDEK